ncbi:hypothetical protein OIU84_023750 [Salix udensis]|uniref:F-box domain-containing protein n=1 Tax=Salix udensis TaxID=889485 RepID=A0AAD6PFD7_9ROSI|nr:hypothetical protein OIU84_023750 [Salix udensis]
MAAGKSGSFKMLEPCKPPPSKKPRKERNQGKSLGTTSSTEVMQREIWKEFPEDLFEAVIARLPVATFFRFRSVCQKWNSVLDSQSFSQHCAQAPQANPWFYTITCENVNSGAMYDPSLKKWNFYVCNPLTQSFKELPPRSVKVWSRVAVGMTLNSNAASGGYKILWVCCDGEHEVYDSLKNSWTRPGSMPSCIKLPLSLNFRSQAVSLGGTLYFMRSDPEGIVSYNMVTGVWKQSIIPAPHHLSDHTLAECEGRIILVGLLKKNAATCVCIWELQKMTLLWKEVDRMPNIWCLDLYGKHVRMTCLGNSGFAHACIKIETNEQASYLQCGEQGMAQGPWLYGATWEKAAMDCMRRCLQPMLDCYGLASLLFGGLDFMAASFCYYCINEVDDT